MSKKAVFNWSGGKDSALALYTALQDKNPDIVRLLTAVNSIHDRVSMHGVRGSLLKAQAAAIGIPLQIIGIPGEVSMKEYDQLMHRTLAELKSEAIDTALFGDIFLEDLRKYREEKLAEVGMSACFPLWKKDTRQLIRDFIRLGFKAIVVCVDAAVLDASFAGRVIDDQFVDDLPDGVDPCGENGEFHTFVFEGPIFREPVRFRVGEKVFREFKSDTNPAWNTSFWYQDLLPFPREFV